MFWQIISICIVLLTGSLTYKVSAGYTERCGVPGRPTDGYFYDKTNDSFTIRYRCNYNYRLVGNTTRHCQQNGMWDQPIPWCEPSLFYKTATITAGETRTDENKNWNIRKIIPWPRKDPKTSTTRNVPLLEPTTIREVILTLDEQPNELTVAIKNQDKPFNCTLRNPPVTRYNKKFSFECSNKTTEFILITFSGTKVPRTKIEVYGNYSAENATCGIPDSPVNSITDIINETVHYTCKPGFKLAGNNNITCRDKQWNGNAPFCVKENGSDSSTHIPPATRNPDKLSCTSVFCDRGYIPVLTAVCVVLGVVLVIVLVVLIHKRKRNSNSDKDALMPDSPSSSQAPLYENIIRIQPNSEQAYATLDFRPNDSSQEPREEGIYAEPTSVGLRGSSQTGSETLYSRIRNPYDVYAAVDKSKKKRKGEPKIVAVYSKINKKKSVTSQSSVPYQPLHAQVNKRKMSVYEIKEEIEKLYETIDEVQTKKGNQGPKT